MTLDTTPPTIIFGPVTRGMLALYAGASGDHNLIHIDSDFAKEAGQPDVFAQGMLSFGVLARVATEWAGQSRVRRFGARFAAITHVHDVIAVSGTIVERFEEQGQACIRLAVEARTQDGQLTLAGEAIIEAH